jgi:uncharacterized protein YlxW (UPF0749 family)
MKCVFRVLAILLIGNVGCQSLYNKTMEKVFGYEKRELLTKAVADVQHDQKKAQEEFKDALTQLKELYAFDGGNVEGMYNKVKGSYDDAKGQADKVNARINNMEHIARSMFAEWKKEIAQYTNPTFAKNSTLQLKETKDRYARLSKSLKSSVTAMEDVLRQLNDYVLYLKHNLNSAALGSLKGEALNIQTDIQQLIQQMNASIVQADDFIKGMPAPSEK